MNFKTNEWRRVVSATIASPAVTMGALTIWASADGVIHEDREVVVGILTCVVDYYGRRATGDFDEDGPTSCTLRGAEREGWHFDHRAVEMQYLLHSDEYQTPMEAEHELFCGGHPRRTLFFPLAGNEPPPEVRQAARDEVRRVFARRAAQRGGQPCD